MKSNSKSYIDKLALFVAFCALALTVWQGMEAHKYNRISVLPHLDVTTIKNNKAHRRGLRIDNSGLGPAKITNVEYFNGAILIKQNKPELFVEWDVLESLGFDISGENWERFVLNASPSGIVLAQGKDYFPIEIKGPLNDGESSFLELLNVRVTYESYYGEKCSVYYSTNKPSDYETSGPC